MILKQIEDGHHRLLRQKPPNGVLYVLTGKVMVPGRWSEK
jgi:hypothetical protein